MAPKTLEVHPTKAGFAYSQLVGNRGGWFRRADGFEYVIVRAVKRGYDFYCVRVEDASTLIHESRDTRGGCVAFALSVGFDTPSPVVAHIAATRLPLLAQVR